MGIQGPNLAFVLVQGVFHVFNFKNGSKKTTQYNDDVNGLGHGVVMSLINFKRV